MLARGSTHEDQGVKYGDIDAEGATDEVELEYQSGTGGRGGADFGAIAES